MTLYALVATAVYDQGVVGIYTSEQLARDAAEEIWPKTDGHHRFRIERFEVDHTYGNQFPYAPGYGTPRRATGPADIELTSRDA